MSMAKNIGINLLLQLLKCQFMVIPHPEILFDSIIFKGRDINRMVPAVTQALCNQMSVTLIRFDTLSQRSKHSGRRKYDTFDSGLCELVIKRITDAACLVATFNRIFIVETEFPFQRFNEANDIFIQYKRRSPMNRIIKSVWMSRVKITLCGNPCYH